MYLVKIFHFKGLDFLNVIKTTLSEWDQIQLLEILQKFDNQHIPDINPWLESINDSVVLFALKLAKIYNQYESKNYLIALLKHPNATIRIDSINVLNHLNVMEAVPMLKNDFVNITLEEQIAFFRMLENIASENDALFVFENINNVHFEIKVSANKIMKFLNVDKLETNRPENIEQTNNIKAS